MSLWSAYAAAPYRVFAAGGTATFRVRRRSAAMDAVLCVLSVREATLVTAANPRSRRLPAACNMRRMTALRARLRRRRMLSGESGAGRWREPQLLVAAPVAAVAPVARRFSQNAIVRVRRAQPPALVRLC